MRDEERIDPMLQAIGEFWHKYPDLRLGQLIENVQFCAGANSLFYVEDDALMQGLVEMERLIR